MNAHPNPTNGATASYELRFRSLFDDGRGYAFPCDAAGHVDLDALGERGADFFHDRGKVARRGEGEQRGEFARIRPEVRRGCALIAEARELHPHEGMVNYGHGGRQAGRRHARFVAGTGPVCQRVLMD